jgi:hypothetical protein
LQSGSIQHLVSNGMTTSAISAGLDTLYPYPNEVMGRTSDSPGMALDDLGVTEGEASESFQATMYLMWDPSIPPAGQPSCQTAKSSFDNVTKAITFTPSTCSSVPVPVQSLQWGFSGTAIKTLDPNRLTSQGSYADTWYLHPGGSGSNPQQGQQGYPQWTFTSGASR